LDTGTHDTLLEAGLFVASLERRQGLKVACIEEIVYALGYISEVQLRQLVDSMGKSTYGKYILGLLENQLN